MAKIDLSKLSIEELQDLARDVEHEIAARREAEKERVLAQMRELAESIGMTLEDLLRQQRKRGSAAGGGDSTGMAAKYRHPENPGLTWAGRGKRPQWVTDWLSSGRTLQELAGKES